MKLVKMSLAAIIAAGAMTTIASATPLEEAIKGVDASGYLRYRYTNNYTKNEATEADHAFKGELTLKTPIQDNFQAVLNIAGNSVDGSGSQGVEQAKYDKKYGVDAPKKALENKARYTPDTDTGATFTIQQFYGVYTLAPANTSFIFGKQKIGGFLVDDIKATGLKVINTSLPGWTFAGVAFDALQKDGDLALGAVDLISKENVYGLGVMGNIEAGAFSLPLQVWAASVTNVGEIYALDLEPSFDLGDTKINGVAQFGMSKLDDKVKNGASDGKIFVVGAGATVSMFDLALGYIHFEADKEGTSATVSLEDSGEYVKPGELLLGYNDFSGENNAFYFTAGFGMGEADAAVEVIALQNKQGGEKVTDKEYVGRVGYKVNKNLKLSSYYAFADKDKKSGDNESKFRFEAKYSF